MEEEPEIKIKLTENGADLASTLHPFETVFWLEYAKMLVMENPTPSQE